MDLKEKLVERRKMIDALYELSKENFTLSDDTLLDKLYVHIEKKSSEDDFSELLRDFSVWLEHVLKLWNSNYLIVGVKVLSIRLLGLIGSKPYGFTTIKAMLPEIEKLLSSSEVQNDSSLMVPLVNDLSLFLNHEEGFKWVLRTEVWKQAVKAFYEDRSIYTNRSGVKFISLLLSKAGNYSDDKGVEILNYVCGPLVENGLLTVKPLHTLDKHYIHPVKKEAIAEYSSSLKKSFAIKPVTRAAKYLCDILDELLINDLNLPIQFKNNITTDLNSNNCPSAQDHQTLLHLVVMLELSNVCWAGGSGEREGDCDCVPCSMEQLYYVTHDAIRALFALGHFTCVMDFCVFCLSRVHRFRVSAPHIHNFSQCSKCRRLESMFVYQLKMFLELHSSCFGDDPCVIEDCCDSEDCYDNENSEESIKSADFGNDCFKKFNEMKTSEVLSCQYFQVGIFSTARSLNYIFYNISRNAISSVVIKTLCKTFNTMKDKPSLKSTMSSSLLHLVTLSSKISEHYDDQCVSKRMFSVVTCILGDEDLEPRITINTLQLLSKLLKTQVVGLIMCDFPPDETNYFDYLKTKMLIIAMSLEKNLKKWESWEIRDSALEVYQSIVEVGALIPSLSNAIFTVTKSLYSWILLLAASDPMAYVRSSAFKFLSKAVRAKLFLDRLPTMELCELGIKTLLTDDMPEPRMAACDLLAAMYITDLLTDTNMPKKVYEAVFTASMKELDWEVKKATLRFWQCMITKKMFEEGVPTSPSCPRSNDPADGKDAIWKIIRVMEMLSDVGCLKVIWSDVTDESDISVSQEACNVIDNILCLDKKWNFIDRIVNGSLISYDDSFEMEVDQENSSKEKLSAKDFFVNICQNSWREKLEGRKNWIEVTCDDLSSLLDHILNPDNRGDWDHNAIDCY